MTSARAEFRILQQFIIPQENPAKSLLYELRYLPTRSLY